MNDNEKPKPRRPPSPRPGPGVIAAPCARGNKMFESADGRTVLACCPECDRARRCVYADK